MIRPTFIWPVISSTISDWTCTSNNHAPQSTILSEHSPRSIKERRREEGKESKTVRGKGHT